MRRHRPLAFLLIVGGLLRLWHLGSRDFWYDEAQGFEWPYCVETNAPLYFVLIRPLVVLAQGGWVSGRSVEFICRLPSVIASIGAIYLLYRLALRMFSYRVAVVSACIMTVSSFHLWYAQEMRGYALAVFLGLMSTFFFWGANVERANVSRNTFLHFVFTALGIYTHYIIILLSAFQACFAFAVTKSFKKTLLVLLPILTLLFWPPFFKMAHFVMQGFWPMRPIPASLAITLGNGFLGYNGTSLFYVTAEIIACGSFLYAALCVIKEKDARKAFLLCGGLFAFPIGTTYLFSQTHPSVYIDRNFLVFTPYLYMVVGYAISRVRIRMLRACSMGILLSALAVSAGFYLSDQMYRPQDPRYHMGAWPKKPFRPLADFLSREGRDRNIIAIPDRSPRIPLEVYTCYLRRYPSGDAPFLYYVYEPNAIDPNFQRLNDVAFRHVIFWRLGSHMMVRSADLVKIAHGSGGRRLFLVTGDWIRSGVLDENAQEVKRALDAEFLPGEEQNFDGLRVFQYQIMPPAPKAPGTAQRKQP